MNKEIAFDKSPDGLVPVIVQDNWTGKVLMLGYMNQEALEKTKNEKIVTFFSRSKQRLWTKGETSDNFLHVNHLLVDCDADTILIKATPAGPTCHTGADTCFDEINHEKVWFINHLRSVIKDRKENISEKSYTSSLFLKGINKIAQKVGEEAVELVIEAKDENKDLFLGEAADLFFHYLILLEQKGYEFDEVLEVLIKRHQ
jgi:phosphoribosyl-ATP pyrophosphohydrolase/phosphoribosyl-AMP cyclohydrolase